MSRKLKPKHKFFSPIKLSLFCAILIMASAVVFYHASFLSSPLTQQGVGDTNIIVGPKMTAHFIDVGQGNSALLEFSCGAILIDAGGENSATTQNLISYLERFFARRPDLDRTLESIMITHPHRDHILALPAILENFKVNRLVHNGRPNVTDRATLEYISNSEQPRHGDIETLAIIQDDIFPNNRAEGLTNSTIDPLACGDTDPKIHVLAGPYTDNPGWPTASFTNLNNLGIVIRVDFGDASLLFTGDMEDHAIDQMVDFYRHTGTLDIDLYHVGHHGSTNGTTENLLTAMSPDLAVISMGRSETPKARNYGHPRARTVDQLDRRITVRRAQPIDVDVAASARNFTQREMQSAIYATGWEGTVLVTFEPDGNFLVAPQSTERVMAQTTTPVP